jgi:hypothetical protein
MDAVEHPKKKHTQTFDQLNMVTLSVSDKLAESNLLTSPNAAAAAAAAALGLCIQTVIWKLDMSEIRRRHHRRNVP